MLERSHRVTSSSAPHPMHLSTQQPTRRLLSAGKYGRIPLSLANSCEFHKRRNPFANDNWAIEIQMLALKDSSVVRNARLHSPVAPVGSGRATGFSFAFRSRSPVPDPTTQMQKSKNLRSASFPFLCELSLPLSRARPGTQVPQRTLHPPFAHVRLAIRQTSGIGW